MVKSWQMIITASFFLCHLEPMKVCQLLLGDGDDDADDDDADDDDAAADDDDDRTMKNGDVLGFESGYNGDSMNDISYFGLRFTFMGITKGCFYCHKPPSYWRNCTPKCQTYEKMGCQWNDDRIL